MAAADWLAASSRCPAPVGEGSRVVLPRSAVAPARTVKTTSVWLSARMRWLLLAAQQWLAIVAVLGSAHLHLCVPMARCAVA